MARLSREFQLVLLGAGILTAGSFLWPDPDPVEVAEKQAQQEQNATTSRSGRVTPIIFLHSRTAPSRTVVGSGFSSAGTIRSGFGGSGARFSTGG